MDKGDISRHLCLMAVQNSKYRRDTQSRLNRLEQIEALLKSGDYLTTTTLAAELNISRRTLFRDLEILREQGLPIEADKGRGGGIRLSARWGMGRLRLDYQEAIDLLISIAIAEQMRSPILLSSLKAIRKLIASFSPELKGRIDTLKSRVWIGQTASIAVYGTLASAEPKAMSPLNEAFLLSRKLTIEYQREDGRQSARLIEPHFFFLSYPVWYVLAWDHLRAATRTFRIDRIKSAELSEDSFMPRSREEFRQAIYDIEPAVP
ncbi:helix-turn-helix transcriptional regulator [Sulfitobacter sp. S45]|uniref:helix-turn-helix transcriptional regulator n=1 Tax=Sulfitobacter sp. S45 TaxID=3368581 RepID=UPI003745649C